MVFVMLSLYAPIIMYVSAELLAGWLLNYFPLSLFVLWILLLSHVMATIKRKGTCVCKRDKDAVCNDAWGARPQPKHNSYAVKLGVCACCLFSYVIIILLLQHYSKLAFQATVVAFVMLTSLLYERQQHHNPSVASTVITVFCCCIACT